MQWLAQISVRRPILAAVLILTLVFRPSGLLGEWIPESEKV